MQSTHHVIKWRSYSQRSFWASLNSLYPARAHAARAAPAPLLMRLPTAYRWAFRVAVVFGTCCTLACFSQQQGVLAERPFKRELDLESSHHLIW
jgi:hypothetical protein